MTFESPSQQYNCFFVNGSLSDNEVDYFQAANRWSEEECKRQETDVIPENKRKVLVPALHEIKFGHFTPEHFAKEVSPTGLLTAEEQTKLYQLIYIDP